MSRETRSSRATSTTTDVSRNARGARAIDSDESCIERLYRTAKDGRRAITASIDDVLCPTPASGFMGREFPDLMARAEGEMVLCLGLMHHLHVNGRHFSTIEALPSDRPTRTILLCGK